MEKIVGWMKIHNTEIGMGITLLDSHSGAALGLENLGRGGVVLLRGTENVILRVGVNYVTFEQLPEEWVTGRYLASYSARAPHPGKRKRGVIVTDGQSRLVESEDPVVIHYYCKHSPTDSHVEELIALARRYIEIDRSFSLTESEYTPTFLVCIVTDTDVVLSESEELTRRVNDAVQPTRSRDLPLLLSGGFSPETILAITSIQNTHSGKVPTYYVPKRLEQVSYPIPRQNKRRIFR